MTKNILPHQHFVFRPEHSQNYYHSHVLASWTSLSRSTKYDTMEYFIKLLNTKRTNQITVKTSRAQCIQGYLLAPTFCNIYTNDITKYMEDLYTELYIVVDVMGFLSRFKNTKVKLSKSHKLSQTGWKNGKSRSIHLKPKVAFTYNHFHITTATKDCGK